MAFDETLTGTKEKIAWSPRKRKYTYASTQDVTNAADWVAKINTPEVYGNIVEIAFESTSPDCDVWVSEADIKAKTDIQTVIAMDSINLGFKPELNSPVYFHNKDTAETNALYVTVSNKSATGTGNWWITITYGPNGPNG